MSNQPENLNLLSDLIVRALHNDLDPAGIDRLNSLLQNSAAARGFYLDFMANQATMRKACGSILNNTNTDNIPQCPDTAFQEVVFEDLEDSAIRRAIALAESECENEEPQPAPKTSLQRRKLTANDWGRILMKTAAIVLLCLSVLWLDRWIMRESAIHPRRVVARLLDQMDAQWDKNRRLPYEDGRMSQDVYRLAGGYARIGFNSGAEVVFQGPAEWILQTEDNVQILSGRAYATVPPQAIGFAVKAGNAKIIDLGTEFGIEVDDQHNTQLHVMKGKTLLISGADHGPKAQTEVAQNHARQVNASGTVQAITLAPQRFVRRIDSRANLAWKGQTTFNLGDVVGGGNGFDTGTLLAGIDTETGNPVKRFRVIQSKGGIPGFHPVKTNPFVDGVLVPDSSNGPVQVSSQGHIFSQCPDTLGKYWVGIQYGGRHHQLIAGGNYQIKDHALRLNNQTWDSSERPAIFIHANQGITFDLDKIRQSIPGLTITQFNALCGLSDTVLDPENFAPAANPGFDQMNPDGLPTANFWVLIDGKERFSKTNQCPTDSPAAVNIPIAGQDRFLTLIVTDTGRECGYLWALFARPQLQLQSTVP